MSILVAPAYNGVDNLNDGKVGSDIGLLLTLGLTERWSFSTGAVYAKKLYEAGYSSYKPDTEIPLNLNYTVINKAKTTVSFGTGISSYIMLKEDYRFNYGYQSNQDPQDISLVNENQHWLSVLNLQANYERKLNSKLSVSLQPYLKVPLNDIGYANVRLQSLGMAISASWNLSL